jgi:regulator of sigma E protease
MTTSLKMIFTGNVSRDDVGSVIMIGQMAGEAAQAGLTPFLMLMALISMNLAFINILPIPALDGGQIMVILIEMLLGKPLSIKTRMRIQSVGMFILLGLMAFLIINDILRVLS